MTREETQIVFDAIKKFEITAYEVECVDCCEDAGQPHGEGCEWKRAHDILKAALEVRT